MTIAYTSGLNFSSPSKGDTDWDVTEAAKDAKISAHGHTGGGQGLQISAEALADNSVGGPAIRLANNVAMRARNAAGSADVDLLKLGTDNFLQLLAPTRFASVEATRTSSGAISVATNLTILDGASLDMTLAAGVEGQLKYIVNINSTRATVTPSTTTGANTVSLGQHGSVLYMYLSGQWRCVPATGAFCYDDLEVFIAAGTYNGYSKTVRCTGTTYTIATPASIIVGTQVMVHNEASADVTFGGAVMATGTLYLYTYTNLASNWRRIQLS